MTNPIYKLFEVFGVELEYMIVDKDSLNILPISGELIHYIAGDYICDTEFNDIGVSNEFVQHVIETRTLLPVKTLCNSENVFNSGINDILKLLAKHNAILMPTAMHPWMNPKTETKLWSYEDKEIYTTFNEIFNCHSHGWANIQSCQLNLPFADDNEFGRLHAAIRLILPILPAISASSPICEGSKAAFLDQRVNEYRNNSRNVPIITGDVIPEQIYSIVEYKKLLDNIKTEIAKVDLNGTLESEWVNARGAIARFNRSAIEIRLIDSQECPLADIAICMLVTEVIKDLVNEKYISYEDQKKYTVSTLNKILVDATAAGENVEINDVSYLKAFGMSESSLTGSELWKKLYDRADIFKHAENKKYARVIELILSKGTLSTRILNRLPSTFSKVNLKLLYSELCACLAEGKLFDV